VRAPRHYDDRKIQENISCEIMQVLKDQADESYPEHVVVEMTSESIEDLDRNVASLKEFVKDWQSSTSNEDMTE
jgi:adenylate kinase